MSLNKEKIFTYAIYLSYFLYIVVALGLSRSAPKYLGYLDYFIRIFVSLFLIIQFNPFRHTTEFNDFDRKVAFSAGVFTFATTGINQILQHYFKKVITK
jgi:hypothetical protein